MLILEFFLPAFFVSETAEKTQKKGDFAAVTVKVDPVCFHICGDTQAKVDSAKKWINDLISKEQTSTAVTDSNIFKLSDADRLCLINIQKKMGVGIRYDSVNGEDALIIEGLAKDVLNAHREIDNMLKKMRAEFNMKSKVEFAGTVVDWQYKQNGQFQSFDALTNYQIEEALQNAQPSVIVTVQGQNYTLDMPDGPATDSQGNILQTRRIDKLNGILLIYQELSHPAFNVTKIVSSYYFSKTQQARSDMMPTLDFARLKIL